MSNIKNIFITVAGSTPQIITESLYDFIIQLNIPVHRIVIITTTHGRDACNKLLLNNGQGAFFEFCRDYDLDSQEMPLEFKIISDPCGTELYDIRSAGENRLAADFICSVVREVAADEKTCILASMAGGRKTMSAYLSYAMLLYGRSKDRLFHVLVAPETIESNPGFFYPPRYQKEIELLNKNRQPFRVQCSDISITNAEIPFLRLRDKIPELNRTDEVPGFLELLNLTQEEINAAQFAPKLKINPAARQITIITEKDEIQVSLTPRQLTVYFHLAKNGPMLNNKQKESSNQQILNNLYNKYFKKDRLTASAFTNQSIRELRSKTNKKIADKIKNQLLYQYVKIKSDRMYYEVKYFIGLAQERMEFIEYSVDYRHG